MNGDKDAWKRMEKYNIQDVVLLENLYGHLLPWIKSHPNHNLFSDGHVCPSCSSSSLHKESEKFNELYEKFKRIGVIQSNQ